jgi:hypothetical protein
MVKWDEAAEKLASLEKMLDKALRADSCNSCSSAVNCQIRHLFHLFPQTSSAQSSQLLIIFAHYHLLITGK